MSSQIRYIQNRLSARLAEKRRFIQVLIGPRQVGKTTAAKGALAGRGYYASADAPTPLAVTEIESWWKQARECPDPILVIDEVQKIRGWSEEVKRLWDQNDGLKLVLLGSSALMIERGLSETLAGRFELIRAEHWNFEEAAEIFDVTLDQFIEYGCYPGSMSLLPDEARWGDYVRDSIVEPAIGRDILQLHPVENPALLREILAVSVANPAQVISLQKIVGQLQNKGAVQTVAHYLSLLQQAFIVSGVQKFSAVPLRTKQTSPKLIVHDNALIRAFERPISAKPSPERLGRYLENAIGARFIEAGWDTFYWKERQYEVDFVVHSPEGEKLAIEVKTSSATAAELRGLGVFCSRNPEFQPVLISGEETAIDGIEWRPISWALSQCHNRE